MAARRAIAQNRTGVITCSDPDCACEPNIVRSGRRVVIGHVVMVREREDLHLCLLCYLSRAMTYKLQGWQFKEQFKI